MTGDRAPILPKYVQRRVQNSLLYLILFTGFLAASVGIYRGGVQLARLDAEAITLHELPWALLLSLFRVLASYLLSLFFSFVLGLLAARTRLGERIIIPILDILQSIPVIGFFPAAISFFIGISNGHRIGVEFAAVFLIFTSQAWNMAFSVYESTKTIPQDNLDAIESFGVQGSQRFWKLFAPAAVPRLVYNSILSWSNGWYFLVACEIIAIGNIKYHLPGIGSFLARAAEQDQLALVLWGLLALSSLIFSFDMIFWRPLSSWSERFRQDYSSGAEASPQTGRMFRLSGPVVSRFAPYRRAAVRMLRSLFFPVFWVIREVLLPLFWDLPLSLSIALARLANRLATPLLRSLGTFIEQARGISLVTLWMAGATLGIWAGKFIVAGLQPPWPALASEIPRAILLSTLRLTLALVLSVAWIVPVALLTYGRPRLRRWLMTIAQLGASLPAVALFPLLIVVLVHRIGGGMELASILLLITGMQWYILFNALGGVAIIPSDLSEAARSLGLTRLETWKRLVLPAMRPALITGLITAWGGGWNALVVSEYVTYREQTLTVNGIGALLNRAVYQLGDQRAIMLCIGGMVAWILILNTLIWRPLYEDAADRYKFDA